MFAFRGVWFPRLPVLRSGAVRRLDMVCTMDNLPNAKSARSPDERDKVRRVVSQRGLCGLANDTKWNEFIDAMRARLDWRPSYRYKCVDGGPSGWDVEWFYHLPFPLVSVEWMDIFFAQEVRIHRLPVRYETIDHSGWIEDMLKSIGLDYRKGAQMIRIFGYSPRAMDLFDE
jgi:hypothetical protein